MKDFSHHIVSSKEPFPHIRRQIKEAAWKYAGVVRSGTGMREGLVKLKELERELKGVVPKNISDKRLKDDLMGAAFVLKAILTASLSREESRGAFIREDFPQQDDLNWRRNSCLVYNRQKDTFSLNHYVSN
jgi:succinate dehydrogenase/fumarate reductase flavoprotein subunit